MDMSELMSEHQNFQLDMYREIVYPLVEKQLPEWQYRIWSTLLFTEHANLISSLCIYSHYLRKNDAHRGFKESY